jgi:A/G-specific adenine glycosylase
VQQLVGLKIALGNHLGTIRHGVTRFRITLDCYEARPTGGRIRSTEASPVRWTPLADLSGLPLSVTARKIATLIVSRS